MNFTIKENMRGEHEIRQDKDKRFRNAFSRTLVITLSLVMLVMLAKVRSFSGKIFSILKSDEIFQTSSFENYNSCNFENSVIYG